MTKRQKKKLKKRWGIFHYREYHERRKTSGTLNKMRERICECFHDPADIHEYYGLFSEGEKL